MARRVTHADRLQAHFYKLADELGTVVSYNRKDADAMGGGWAGIWRHNSRLLPNEAEVCLPHRIRNTVEYFVGLHELGHIHDHKGPRGFRWGSRPTLEAEWYAWRWALANACVKPTKAVWADIADALNNYALTAQGDKRYKDYPYFWALLAKARERR